MINVLYIPQDLLDTLKQGTSRKLDVEPGFTMDTEVLELYEDWLFKTGKVKRPNKIIDLFASINTYDLIDIEDRTWQINIHELTLREGIKQKKGSMKLEKKVLYVTHKGLEYFKVITGAKYVVVKKP